MNYRNIVHFLYADLLNYTEKLLYSDNVLENND